MVRSRRNITLQDNLFGKDTKVRTFNANSSQMEHGAVETHKKHGWYVANGPIANIVGGCLAKALGKIWLTRKTTSLKEVGTNPCILKKHNG